jgi:hypothetical protein
MSYDAKAVKIGKELKSMIATMPKNLRRAAIKMFVTIQEDAATTRSSKNKKEPKK